MAPQFIVLAIGEGVVLGIVLIISLISWVMNLISGANKPKPREGNRPRPNQGQSELERFLKEVVGGKVEPEKKRPAPPPPKPVKAAAEKKSKPQKPATAQRPAATDRPGNRIAQTHLTPSTVGDGVRSHVSTSLEARNVDNAVKRDVDANVRRNIDDAVQRDIGTDGTVISTKRAVHPLVAALRNPEGIRQAIVMNEILNRPKSMR